MADKVKDFSPNIPLNISLRYINFHAVAKSSFIEASTYTKYGHQN